MLYRSITYFSVNYTLIGMWNQRLCLTITKISISIASSFSNVVNHVNTQKLPAFKRGMDGCVCVYFGEGGWWHNTGQLEYPGGDSQLSAVPGRVVGFFIINWDREETSPIWLIYAGKQAEQISKMRENWLRCTIPLGFFVLYYSDWGWAECVWFAITPMPEELGRVWDTWVC